MRILLIAASLAILGCSQEKPPVATDNSTVIDGQIKVYNDAKGLEQQMNDKAQDDKRNIDEQINH